jgi:hypothetical protein
MNASFRADLQMLADTTARWCVSLYLPTHRTGNDTRQDPIRLKNLLGRAEEELLALGVRGPGARELLAAGRRLLEDAVFWTHQQEGLALFLAPALDRTLRLPIPVKEVAVVADRFHLKPLLPLLGEDGSFYVLALSQNEVRVFRGSRHTVQEIPAKNLPASLADALKFDDPELSLQHHAAGHEGAAGETIFHGHGAATEEHKKRLLRYFQQIDRGLQELLGNDRAPLVLAGVDYYLPIYREANTYPNLAEENLPGNPEPFRPEELQARAWELLRPRFEAARDRAEARFREWRGTGRTADAVAEVVLAARDGRIDTLFVANDAQCWGTVDPEARQVHVRQQPQPGDEDLLDHAAVHTFLKGGTVYAVPASQMPGEGPLACLLRF